MWCGEDYVLGKAKAVNEVLVVVEGVSQQTRCRMSHTGCCLWFVVCGAYNDDQEAFLWARK